MYLRLTLIASLAAVVLAVGPATASAGSYDYLVAPMTHCGGTQQTNTSLSTGAQESVMLCLHNYARRRAGRAGLRGNSLLYSSSNVKTADMMRCRSFSHNACGRDALYHVKRLGYTRCNSWRAGENIAWGSGSYGSVRAIMTRWVNSTGHRTNILNLRVQGSRRGTAQGILRRSL
ncbi:MAG: hypothetical protein H0U12_07285 [Thermoleophilaceae bacterium]|nr:hypothetical protein [Thermoleophilaceae bacterium]